MVVPQDAAAYTLNDIIIVEGDLNNTGTLTAVNNKTDAANYTTRLILGTHPARMGATTETDTWVRMGTTTPSLVDLIIVDEDILTTPTALKLSVDGQNIQADWTAPSFGTSTGYRVEWDTATTGWDLIPGTQKANVSGGTNTTHKITSGLNANTRYYVRIIAAKDGYDESSPSDVKDTTTHGASTVDYDADNDGLIEVATTTQLNAMRWDLDGDGVVDDAAFATDYNTAFPNAEANMGCNEGVVTIQSGTGNPACTGYELAADLDFDTGTAGDRTDDTYYNSGAGWLPIGDGTTAYTAKFDGNNDTDASGDGGPYTITNLHVNATSSTGTSYAGLFGVIGSGATVSNVALTKVDVAGTTSGIASGDAVYAGALAGKSSGAITESWSLGEVKAHATGTTTSNVVSAYAGGLVGWNDGTIRSTYSRAAVTAASHAYSSGYAGGLVGRNSLGKTIAASYAAGDVTANRGADTGTANNSSHAGGLVGDNSGTITASYATGDGATVGKDTYTGGLAGSHGGTITASYSLGKQSATALNGGSAITGGLVGGGFLTAVITNSYWDKTTSGITTGSKGVGKTTSELQTPTTTAGIYASWDVDVDGDSTNDDPWHFGTSSQYPALHYGSHVLTKQRASTTIAAAPTTIWERDSSRLSRSTSTDVTATLSHAWEDDLTVTLPTPVAGLYTLSTTTITFAAGTTTPSRAVTMTAVDDTIDQVSPDSRSVSISTTTIDSYVVALNVTTPTITINDDDNVHKVTGVTAQRVGNSTTTARISWNVATGTDAYKVQWKSGTESYDSSRQVVVSGHTATTTVVTGLTPGTAYTFRVIGAATGELDAPPSDPAFLSPGTDYDTDDDGMIEVANLAQLDAIRYDLDADGAPSSGNEAAYATAFPAAASVMGCNEDVLPVANRGCIGYELRADLDFDTGTAGDRTDDTYYNSGAGWEPIGAATTTPYTGNFDGNADTDASGDGGPYTISNLFIDRTSGSYAGLFAYLNGTGKTFEDVALPNVDVTFNASSTANVYTGGLAGRIGSGVAVSDSYTTGRVRAGESASDPSPSTPARAPPTSAGWWATWSAASPPVTPSPT